MKIKVIAIVVSLNRPHLLKRCINHLKNQLIHHNLDLEILIVDNGSEDDLKSWIADSGNHYIFQDNVGSAGGFHAGLIHSFKSGYDFYWLMDDDGYPEENCLNKLIDCANSNKNISVFSPNLFDEFESGHFSDIFKQTDLKYINHVGGPWNGILVKNEVFTKVGFPNISFFIWGEEYEFFNRVKNYGFLTVLVADARFVHKKTGFKLNKCPRPFFLIRNLIWIFRLNNFNSQFESKYKFLFRALILSIKLIFFSFTNFNFDQLFQTLRGIYHGILKKIPSENINN